MEDNITDMTGVTYNADSESYNHMMRELPYDLTFLIFCAIGALSDVAIIQTILRYKKVRTPENIIVANWAAADFCALLTCPSGYRIMYLTHHYMFDSHISCILFEFGILFHILVVLFICSLCIDWFIKVHIEKLSNVIRPKYKYVLALVWTCALIYSVFWSTKCRAAPLSNSEMILFFACVGAVLVWLICQLSRLTLKCRRKVQLYSNLSLKLVGLFFLSNVLGLFVIMSGSLMFWYYSVHWLTLLAACFVFASGLVNFITLLVSDQNFLACFKLSLKFRGVPYTESLSELENRASSTTSNENADKFVVRTTLGEEHAGGAQP